MSHASAGHLVHDAISMLFTVLPVADLLLPVFPEKLAKPMFFIILVIAFIHPAIWPCKYPIAIDPVMFPGAFKHPAVHPGVLAVAMYVVFLEITCLTTAIRPLEFPF